MGVEVTIWAYLSNTARTKAQTVQADLRRRAALFRAGRSQGRRINNGSSRFQTLMLVFWCSGAGGVFRLFGRTDAPEAFLLCAASGAGSGTASVKWACERSER